MTRRLPKFSDFLVQVLKTLTRAGLVLLFLGCASLLGACAPQYSSDLSPALHGVTKSGFVEHNDAKLYFTQRGDPQQPLVLFIHGTPGSWRGFQGYLENPRLSERVHMIAVDRLGFGRSEASGARPSFEEQAAAIAKVMQLNRSGHKTIVVGHSLGGSIGYRLAIDHSDSVAALIAVSSALDPSISNPRWYNKLARLRLSQWLVSKELTTSNKEMLQLKPELEAIQPHLAELTLPITILQGGEDWLVLKSHTVFAQAATENQQIRIIEFPERGHFVVWEELDSVVDEIVRAVDRLENSAAHTQNSGNEG